MNKLKTMKLKLSAHKVAISIFCAVIILGGVVLVGAYSSSVPSNQVIENVEVLNITNEASEEGTLGAMSSPDVYSYLKVHGRFLQGGYMGTDAPAIATSTTDTITATQVWTYSGLDYTPGTAAMDITLPASSTLSFLGSGECLDWRFRNLDSDTATTTTFVAGAGIDLVENENGDVVIEGGNEARLTLCRELDTDVTVYVDEYVAAD